MTSFNKNRFETLKIPKLQIMNSYDGLLIISDETNDNK